MAEKETISSEVGSTLLFENDRVRVWDLRLEPGQSTGMHRHVHDYLYVVIGDGKLQGVSAAGEKRQPAAMQDGEVVFNQVDGEAVHAAINAGESPWRNIIVEFKTASKE